MHGQWVKRVRKKMIQYIPWIMHMVLNLLHFVVCWFYPYSSGLIYRHWSNHLMDLITFWCLWFPIVVAWHLYIEMDHSLQSFSCFLIQIKYSWDVFTNSISFKLIAFSPQNNLTISSYFKVHWKNKTQQNCNGSSQCLHKCINGSRRSSAMLAHVFWNINILENMCKQITQIY